MDHPQKPPQKPVDPQSESRWDSATIITVIALVFSLPFSVSASLLIVMDVVDLAGIIDLPVEAEAASSWAAWATLLQWSTAFSFFFALPGAVLAIAGFIMRRTRLAAITLAVAAAPWFLFAILYVVAYLFFPEILV